MLASRALIAQLAGVAGSAGRDLHGREPSADTTTELTSWVYELLDAHTDTTRLASDLECDPYWSAHLDYLRDLQRRGRETLARASRSS